MAEFDTIIKGGIIVDGTRAPRYKADIGIKGGTIVKIGRLKSSDAKQVLDASGLIVAPGAIDLHTHYDAQVHWDPYCTIASWHGVTSVTIGNCGFGFAPVYARDAERAMLAMSRNEAIPLASMQAAMPFNWETFPQWMDHLDSLPLGINLSHLLPVSPAVAYAMGGFAEAKKRFPTEQETAKVVQLLNEAMDAGAVGWGAQRLMPEGFASVQRDYDGTPMISDVLPDEFYLALARGLGKRGEGCIQFTQVTASLKDPAGGLQNDFAFNRRLAEESGRPVIYNAVAVNDRYPDFFRMQLKWLEEVNTKGLNIYGQAATVRAPFTMTFEDWNLFDNSPIWREATLGTVEEKKAKLANPEIRKAMKEEYDSGTMPINLFGEIHEYLCQETQREDLKKYEGLSVGQIAEMEHKHLLDALLDISVADNLKTVWVTPVLNSNTAYTREMMQSPYIFAGISDGGAHVKLLTPGVYPTDMLTWMVRDSGVIALEEAHFRLSYMPARAAGFKDRGCLLEGLAADLVVYDLEKLNITPSEVAYDLPAGEWRRVQKAEGYRWVMVNGQVTFEEGKCTGATPGKLLRFGQVRQ
jgi:N-acyl-D-amino-acid deacylase